MAKKKEQPIDGAELRRRAEERLGEKNAPPLGTEKEPLRLHHELQVHQVELEMQNAELRQARNELETALEQYTDLYDFAPASYFTLDRKGTILRVNLTGAGLVGVERSMLVGRRFGLFVNNESRPAFNSCLEKFFTSPTKESCEVALQRDGNAPLIVLVEGMAAASGQECRIALVDITERKRAEEVLHMAKVASEAIHLKKEAVKTLSLDKKTNEALRLSQEANEALRLSQEANEALRRMQESAKTLSLEKEAAEMIRLAQETAESFRLAQEAAEALHLAQEAAEAYRLEKEAAEKNAKLKSQFLVNMSHELRTPMTGILGMLQLTLEQDLAPVPREYLEMTQSSALSLLRILNDILDMAKFEAGKLTIEAEPFSLQWCITQAVDIITPEVRRKGLDFTISVADEVPDTVVGDQVRLRQVLINLIGNAVKFTEGGKVEVRVTAGIGVTDGKREFTFVVTDTGIGIPDDKKVLLFRAFSQVDASLSRSYGGTGLGLAISREIVELMGGTISFVSEEGVGSTFSFTLPLKEAGLERDALSAAESLPAEVITPAQDGERIPRILLAEDDPVIRQVLILMFKQFKQSNYNLDVAEDGLKAIEMWEKGGYDLILMDVQMPRLNGFDATRAIREKERERGGHIPIVAMTAHARKEDEESCLSAGMDAYISKPIDFKKSLQLIGDIIRKTATP
jgi:PAS domain S-box-containing protein